MQTPGNEENMRIRIRFFARFRELLGAEVIVEPKAGTSLKGVVREIAEKTREGHDAIFDEHGSFREFVILMRNGKRVEIADAATVTVADGDEIAVFPPVAGG
jgi:molybdopterin synthase sulfur carrier subunit